MKTKQVLDVLEQLGWSCSVDEVGDKFCRLNIGSVVVQIIPFVGKRPGHLIFSLEPSVSTKEFSDAAGFIFDGPAGHDPIIVRNDSPEKVLELTPEVVQRFSRDVISWAEVQDIKKGLEFYMSLPTDAKGARPLRHLAALAIAGDIGRLRCYEESFKKGDRLGFVPYITEDMISRAISLAEKVRSEE